MIHAFLLELKEIKNSFFLFSLLSWIPLVSFLIIISIFHEGTAKNLPITVIDNDNSKLSRQVITQINAHSLLHVEQTQKGLKHASQSISSGETYANVVIPSHFERDVMQKKQPRITAFVNTQYLLIGKMVSTALSETIRQSSARVDFATNLIKNGQQKTALSETAPIQTQITPFFNTYKNYFLFLVSAIIPTLLQILIVISTILSFGKTFKDKREKEFFKKTNIFKSIIGKTLPYTLAYLTWGIVFLLYMYGVEPWEFQGSFAIVFVALLLMILAYQGIALSFFSLNFHTTRALSLGALYTAPAFAFLGITFPVSSMPEFAFAWHNILPISHYLKIQIAQASYGSSAIEVLPLLINLIYFLPAWIFVILKVRNAV
jgi:ABC-2 type transport system permease protein